MPRFLPLLGLAALALAAPARADFLNGGFETGDFDGWATTGDTAVVGAQGDIPVPAGSFQALLSTQPSGTFAGALESFLGLPPGRLAALSDSPLAPFNGSALRQDVAVNAGDTLTFQWNFLTNGTGGGGDLFNDISFVSIVGGPLDLSAVLGSATDPSLAPTTAPGFAFQSGYQPFTYTFAQAGTYAVGVGVVNVGDPTRESGLLVDSFAVGGGGGPVNPIPEPASVTLLGLGAFAAAAYRRRRRAAA